MSGFEDVNHDFRKAARIMGLSSRAVPRRITPYRDAKAEVRARRLIRVNEAVLDLSAGVAAGRRVEELYRLRDTLLSKRAS